MFKVKEATVPVFKKDLHCPFCDFRFTATIRMQPGDGPNTEYVVYCPENASRLRVYRHRRHREHAADQYHRPADARRAQRGRDRCRHAGQLQHRIRAAAIG